MSRKLTTLILVGLFALAMIYDFVVALNGNWDITISITVYNLAKENPIIPFLIGLVCGHLLWPIQKNNE